MSWVCPHDQYWIGFRNAMNRNEDKRVHPVLGAADRMSFAAAPTFAIMALLTGTLGGGPPDMLCSAAHGLSPLSGMVVMYLRMSAFHSAPWLKLISRRRSNRAWRRRRVGGYDRVADQ